MVADQGAGGVRHAVFAGGVVMDVSFALQWLISVRHMWFMRAPLAGAWPD